MNSVNSSFVIGTKKISVPLVATIGNSFLTLSAGVSHLRKAVLAFLVISMIGSGLSAIATLVAIHFPQSHLLICTSIFCLSFAALSAFLAACIFTAGVLLVVHTLSGLSDALSLYIRQGNTVLLTIWLSWLLLCLANCYWAGIWFVEIRRWTLTRRKRANGQRDDWNGIWKELCEDMGVQRAR